jgi:hypothetical protein
MKRNKETVELFTVSKKRRRSWSTAKKRSLRAKMYKPRITVALVARKQANKQGLGKTSCSAGANLRKKSVSLH